MSIGAIQRRGTFPTFRYQKLAGWLLLAASLLALTWVVLVGIIAVPYPSFLSLCGGPAIACFFAGLGFLTKRQGLLLAALAAFLIGILGWGVLP